MLIPVAMGSSGVHRTTGAANRKDAFNEEPSFLSNDVHVFCLLENPVLSAGRSVAGFSVAPSARLTANCSAEPAQSCKSSVFGYAHAWKYSGFGVRE